MQWDRDGQGRLACHLGTLAVTGLERLLSAGPPPVSVLHPAGVPPNRIAYITGQAPKEPEAAQQDAVQAAAQQQQQQQQQQQAAAPPRPSQQLSEAEIVAVLQRYLEPRLGTGGEARVGIRAAASSQQPIPWEELGLARGGPRMGGIECDLRRLWRLAYLDQGGFDALGAAGGWPAVAQKLGADLKRITNAGGCPGEVGSQYVQHGQAWPCGDCAWLMLCQCFSESGR